MRGRSVFLVGLASLATGAQASPVAPLPLAQAQLQRTAVLVREATWACSRLVKGTLATYLAQQPMSHWFPGWTLADDTAWTPWHTPVRLMVFPDGQVILRYSAVPLADCAALVGSVPNHADPLACHGPAASSLGTPLDLPLP